MKTRNRVDLIGYVGAAPEIGVTPTTNVQKAILRLATHERIRDPAGKLIDHTEWHRVVIFGPAAAAAADRFKVGDLVLVDGRLRTDRVPTRRSFRSETAIYAREVIRLRGRLKDDPEIKRPPKDE